MVGNNYSAAKWEARANAEEPCGPALGLLHSGKRQRGHHGVWLEVPGSALAYGKWPCLCLMSPLWAELAPCSCRQCKECSWLCSEHCVLFFKLSPLTLGECRITPWKAEGSGVPAVSVGLARVPLTSLPNAGCAESVMSFCQAQLAAVHVPGIGLSPRAPEGRCSEIPVWCATSLRGEHVHCTLQGSESVFYQLFSLLPSISNLSVNFNPPINLPEGNMSQLFLNLIIESLLHQEFISGGRGLGAQKRMPYSCVASNTASIRNAVEVRPSSQCCCHHMFDLLCARDTKKLPMIAIGAALLVAKIVWWSFVFFFSFPW